MFGKIHSFHGKPKKSSICIRINKDTPKNPYLMCADNCIISVGLPNLQHGISNKLLINYQTLEYNSLKASQTQTKELS